MLSHGRLQDPKTNRNLKT